MSATWIRGENFVCPKCESKLGVKQSYWNTTREGFARRRICTNKACDFKMTTIEVELSRFKVDAVDERVGKTISKVEQTLDKSRSLLQDLADELGLTRRDD